MKTAIPSELVVPSSNTVTPVNIQRNVVYYQELTQWIVRIHMGTVGMGDILKSTASNIVMTSKMDMSKQ